MKRLLSVHLFGPPLFKLDGTPVEINRNKAAALLAYLAVSGNAHSRDAMAALFWPDYDQRSAYAYLRRTLWSLNNALGEGWIAADRNTISLNIQKNIWVDVNRFIEIYSNCIKTEQAETRQDCLPDLNEAASLYKNHFLAGFTLRDSPDFDDWQVIQTQELRRMLSSILERLVWGSAAVKQWEQAQNHTHRWLSLDQVNEDAHRTLMQIYFLSGQRGAALKHYQECRRILKVELGVEPQKETQALYLKIKSGNEVPPLLTQKTETTSLSQPAKQLEDQIPPVDLPNPASFFVGREKELEEIKNLLLSKDCRLLTLHGPGGVGKTRLALQASSNSARLTGVDGDYIFRQGVYFVPLAPLKSSKQLIPTIADSLNITFQSEVRSDIPKQEPLAQLIDYLRDKRVLIFMDNFEHLVDGAGFLSQILAAAPGVKILVTSRVRLNIYEEWALDVAGLSFPNVKVLDLKLSGSEIMRFSAVDLFVKNAQRVSRGFTPGSEDLILIAKICEMVDGLPLGIELASSWIRILSLKEIVSEVKNSLDFLTTSLRNLPERHRSLRAVFDQSWAMLTRQEQKVLKRLSLIRGSFDREAARRIAEADLSLLSSLVDKSLVHTHTEGLGHVRYHMHDMVKQYAIEKLEASALEMQHGQDLHAKFFGDLMHEIGKQLKSSEQIPALERVEEVLEDVRAAWRWSLEQGYFSNLFEIAEIMIIFHDIRGRLRDIQDLIILSLEKLEKDGELLDDVAAGFYALCLAENVRIQEWSQNQRDLESVKKCLGVMERLRSQYLPKTTYVSLFFGAGVLSPQDSFQIYQNLMESYSREGDLWGLAITQFAFSNFLLYMEENEQLAWHLKQEALERFKEIGNQWGIALCTSSIANQAYTSGDYSKARELAIHSASIYQELGDTWRTIASLITLGQALTAQGEYSEADKRYKESLELARDLGNRNSIAVHLDCLGYIELLTGSHERAQEYYQESLNIYTTINEIHGIGMANMNLGDIARLRGQLDEAHRFYSEGLRCLENIDVNDSWKAWGLMMIYKKLGILAFHQGNHQIAREYYLKGMEKAWESSRTSEILEILIGVAELAAGSGQHEKAILYLAQVANHPSTPKEALLRAKRLLSQSKNEVPAGVYVELSLLGINSTLEEICQEMLPE